MRGTRYETLPEGVFHTKRLFRLLGFGCLVLSVCLFSLLAKTVSMLEMSLPIALHSLCQFAIGNSMFSECQCTLLGIVDARAHPFPSVGMRVT